MWALELSPAKSKKLPEQTASQVKFGPCEWSELCVQASQIQFYQANKSKSRELTKLRMLSKQNKAKKASKLAK